MEKLKGEKDLSRITFSLSRGKFDGESRNKIIVPYIILTIIFGAGIILAMTMFSIEYMNGKSSLAGYIGGLISITFGFSILPFVWFILIFRNEKIRKEILLWVEDSIELNAYCKNLGVKFWLGIPLNKVQVEFDIDGIHYVRTTDDEKRGILDIRRPVGFFTGIAKFTDRHITILYSFKYDQVMILKA